MKKFGMLVAALALGVAATVSQAADQAWFSSSAAGTTASGPGLALAVDVSSGESITIGYNFTNTFNSGMAGWAFELNSNNPTATFSDGANAGLAGYDTNVGGTNGSSSFFAGQSSIPGIGAAGLAYTFSMTVNAPVGTIVLVTGDFGPSEQYYGNGSGYPWFGSVGPNQGSYGYHGTATGWGQLPVIAVRVVPEPATLGLIGLAVVALIRRRK